MDIPNLRSIKIIEKITIQDLLRKKHLTIKSKVNKITTYFTFKFIVLNILLSLGSFLHGRSNSNIYLNDKTIESGINFVHYAPRPRWCEIGPSVVGSATNEELSLVFNEEEEFWNSNGRLLTLDEFANVHLIKMNGSGGAWLDYDKDGDWDLYLINCQGGQEVTNSLYQNQGNGQFVKIINSGLEDTGEGMSSTVADYNNDGFPDIFITNYGNFKLFKNNGIDVRAFANNWSAPLNKFSVLSIITIR